jgi:DNA ligase-1
MMLGKLWVGQPAKGWLASEKFNGCRAYWDGAALWTRGGKQIAAPAWFTAGLPADMHVEGEVIDTSGDFYAARDAVNYGRFTEQTRWVIFDAPQCAGNLAARLDAARVAVAGLPHVSVISAEPVKSDSHLRTLFQSVIKRGGEGLMLHHPSAGYRRGRTDRLLKVKVCA